MSLFIRTESTDTTDKERVTYVRYNYDALSPEQKAEEGEGYEVNEIPEPDNSQGIATLYYKPSNSSLYYEYRERPKTEIELLREENTLLGQQIVMLELRLLQLEGSAAQ